jgi:hypothetical protein
MDNLINFDTFKKYKDKEKILEKSEKVIEELKMVVYIINLSISGLSHFDKYVFVTECISVLQNNKVLLEIHLNKYKKAVEKIKEEIKNGKLEKASKEDSK